VGLKNKKSKNLKNPIAKEVRSRKYRPQVVQSDKLYNRQKERNNTLKAAATEED